MSDTKMPATVDSIDNGSFKAVLVMTEAGMPVLVAAPYGDAWAISGFITDAGLRFLMKGAVELSPYRRGSGRSHATTVEQTASQPVAPSSAEVSLARSGLPEICGFYKAPEHFSETVLGSIL